MFKICITIFFVFKGYDLFNIYQQAHYHLKPYLKHYLLNLFYTIFIPLLTFIGLYFCSHWAIYLFFILYELLYCYFLFLSPKKRLKFSNRIKGMCICYIFCLIPLFFISKELSFLYLFSEYLIIILFLPYSHFMHFKNQKYIIKAHKKLKSFKGKIIGITGSAGKTSTKWILSTLLKEFYTVIQPAASHNTPLGIAKFINENDIHVDFIILEYGISHPKDMDQLLKVAVPDISIFTEVLPMHLEGMKSVDNILLEKNKLMEASQISIVNFENDYLYEFYKEKKVLSYGIHRGDFQCEIINTAPNIFQAFNEIMTSKLVGRQQVLNTMAALCVLHYLEVPFAAVRRILPLLQNFENRLCIRGNQHIIIDDAYNSNVLGFKMALELLGQCQGFRVLLTPGIVELGKYEKVVYEDLVEKIVLHSDAVVLVGKLCGRLRTMLKGYPLRVFQVSSFKQGYKLSKNLIKDYPQSAILIENDLPDLYKIGFTI